MIKFEFKCINYNKIIIADIEINYKQLLNRIN